MLLLRTLSHLYSVVRVNNIEAYPWLSLGIFLILDGWLSINLFSSRLGNLCPSFNPPKYY